MRGYLNLVEEGGEWLGEVGGVEGLGVSEGGEIDLVMREKFWWEHIENG